MPDDAHASRHAALSLRLQQLEQLAKENGIDASTEANVAASVARRGSASDTYASRHSMLSLRLQQLEQLAVANGINVDAFDDAAAKDETSEHALNLHSAVPPSLSERKKKKERRDAKELKKRENKPRRPRPPVEYYKREEEKRATPKVEKGGKGKQDGVGAEKKGKGEVAAAAPVVDVDEDGDADDDGNVDAPIAFGTFPPIRELPYCRSRPDGVCKVANHQRNVVQRGGRCCDACFLLFCIVVYVSVIRAVTISSLSLSPFTTMCHFSY
jgi:hypothetical protein